jgi:hypothetical protein
MLLGIIGRIFERRREFPSLCDFMMNMGRSNSPERNKAEQLEHVE